MIGERFGMLIVVGVGEPHTYPSGRKRKRYNCKCDCGNTVLVLQTSLKSGNNKSCGCWKSIPENNIKYSHGLCGHPINKLWTSIKNRCNNPNSHNYHIYGGRGISVCDDWANDFKYFYDWAMSNGWASGLHIDRIDNNKGYGPDNCRFVTPKENMNNRRSNITIGICGEFKTLSNWCEFLNVNWQNAYDRFRRTGDIFYALGIA